MSTFGALLKVHAGKDEVSIKKLQISLNGRGLDFFAGKFKTGFKLRLFAILIAKDDKDSKIKLSSGKCLINIQL